MAVARFAIPSQSSKLFRSSCLLVQACGTIPMTLQFVRGKFLVIRV